MSADDAENGQYSLAEWKARTDDEVFERLRVAGERADREAWDRAALVVELVCSERSNELTSLVQDLDWVESRLTMFALATMFRNAVEAADLDPVALAVEFREIPR